VMIGPKLLGVFGLITLPSGVLSGIIFSIVMLYSLSYIFNKPFRSNNRLVDAVFLMAGGYISGTSLIGAADHSGGRPTRRQGAPARHTVCAMVYSGYD